MYWQPFIGPVDASVIPNEPPLDPVLDPTPLEPLLLLLPPDPPELPLDSPPFWPKPESPALLPEHARGSAKNRATLAARSFMCELLTRAERASPVTAASRALQDRAPPAENYVSQERPSRWMSASAASGPQVPAV